MGITVEFKDYEEMVTFAKVLLAGSNNTVNVQASAQEPLKQAIKKPVEQQAPAEQPQDEAPAQEETQDPQYTLEQVRAKLTELSRNGKAKQVKAILDSFGAANVTALKEKDYTAVMEKAGAI